MSFYRFGQGWQQTSGREKFKIMSIQAPLPFDEIDDNLLDRLEELQPMSYERLDSAGISAYAVRNKMREKSNWDSDWLAWKTSVCSVSGKSWAEIAPIIYHNY
jgi:hypothetical protein